MNIPAQVVTIATPPLLRTLYISFTGLRGSSWGVFMIPKFVMTCVNVSSFKPERSVTSSTEDVIFSHLLEATRAE